MDNATLRWRYCQDCDVYPNCGECDVKKEIEKNSEDKGGNGNEGRRNN